MARFHLGWTGCSKPRRRCWFAGVIRLGSLRFKAWPVFVLLLLVGHSISMCQEEAVGETVPAEQPSLQYTVGSLEGTLDPDEYTLGAGDVLAIGFWGDVNRLQTVTVNPDGDILVAPVGPISVDGLALGEVRDLVKSRLSAYYRPSILSVSLISIRSFQVHIVGMVASPGAVLVNGVTRVSQAIGMAGGLRQGASQRNITIKRGDAVVPADLTRYFHLGDNGMNPFLKDGDVVFVPPSGGTVSIFGGVFREGVYEFVEGESLADVMAIAGGLRPDAWTESIEIERFEPDDPTVSRPIFVRGEPALLQSMKLAPGDRVFIRAIPDWHEDASVTVQGEVKYPGVYVIEEGIETLSEVIARAGGLTPDASLAEARLLRDLYASRGFPIERELDVLREMDDSRDSKDTDLIKSMSRERKGRMALSFETIFLSEHEDYDPPLMDGDIITIPRASRYIRVSGQVANPGIVTLKDGEDFKYYIREAGGYISKADKRGTVLIRAVGGQRVKPGGQEIRPGDIIWVPRKADHDWWGITKDILTVAAQVATVWLVVDGISRN
jgi:polysaccharide export outer membrane protein